MSVWTKRKGDMSRGNRKKDGEIDNNRAGTQRGGETNKV